MSFYSIFEKYCNGLNVFILNNRHTRTNQSTRAISSENFYFFIEYFLQNSIFAFFIDKKLFFLD